MISWNENPPSTKYQTATNKYMKMVDEKLEVVVEKGVKRTTWVVVDDIKESDVPVPVEHVKQIGMRGFDFPHKPTKEGGDSRKLRNNFLKLVIHMWPGNWKEQFGYVNSRIEESQVKLKTIGGKKVLKLISENEFWKFISLLLASRLEGRTRTLWDNNHNRPTGILRSVDYSKYMPRPLFLLIRPWRGKMTGGKSCEE